MRQAVRVIAHRNTSGNISLRLRCLVGDKYHDIATGLTVTPAEWDGRRQRVKPSCDTATETNRRLNDIIDLATRYLQLSDNATIDGLRSAISDAPSVSTTTLDDFYETLNAFIASESRRNTWSNGTIKRFRSLSASLFGFSPVLHFSTLTADILDRYIAHRASQGYNNTTIGKDIKLLRWFLRWCHDNGCYTGNLHEAYTPHLKGSNYEYKEVIYLTLEELHTLEYADLPLALSNVRDIFVFCCYTGLRYSDAAKLKTSDIHDDAIEIVTRKTDKRLRIDLNRHASAILARHAGKDYPHGLALPVISNQNTNDNLKRIGELCHIDSPVTIVKYSGNRRIETTVPKYQLLSSHCARRTFVVSALQLGIPVEVIMRWTGHSDYKAMKPYIAIADTLKAQQMAKFDTL